VYNEKSKKHPKKNALNPLVIRHFRGAFSQNQVQNSGGLAFFIITALFFLGCLISGLISSSLLFICVIALLPLPVLWYNKAKVGEADD